MRPLEALLIGVAIVSLLLRWVKPRTRQFTASTMAMLGIFLGLHLGFDGPRWEMIPTYGMLVAGAWILASDLRRVSGAKAGESSRWMAVPSAAKRALTGALLAVVAVVSVALPYWIFPRIVFPTPDGAYAVGRVDVFWTDSTRTLESGISRPIPVSAWYPAESPSGRRLRYHPNPGALGADLARGTPLPGFAFHNLTSAVTFAAADPHFSVREGRSPLVLVSHDVGSNRMEGTDLYERMASRGYVVVSIGHAGSAVGMTAADGSSIPFAPGGEAAELADRIGDVRFVLDRINRLPVDDAIDSLAGHIRLDRVAVLGRGVGGAAVGELLATDARLTAGVAITPDTLGPAASRGVHRPLLIFTVQDPGHALDGVFRYGGTEVRLEGATERSLSDLALLGAPIVTMLGIESTDAPADIHGALSALTLRFLDQYLKDRQATEVDLPAHARVRVIPHQAR